MKPKILFFRERNLRRMSQRDISPEVNFVEIYFRSNQGLRISQAYPDPDQYYLESLILAQDERWRRA